MIGEDVSFTLATHQDQTLFAPSNCLNSWDVQSRHIFTDDGPFYTLYAGEGGGRGYVMREAEQSSEYIVRRLTPTECERLQGFPDGWTDIEYRGKPAADGPRYKALGNSWAVPCARWVGERIEMVEKLTEVDI